VEKIARACELAKIRGAKRALLLTVAGAYHSRLMASAQSPLQHSLSVIAMQPPAVPVISNVTALPHGAVREIQARLVEQVVSPVNWEGSLRYLLAQGFTRFIELGPGKVLSGFLKRIDPQAQLFNVADPDSLEKTVHGLTTAA
jgi:[acyl-carrier-protein] S-malonyltransferase